MGFALLVARLILAAVFGVAGIAKLADLAGSKRAMVGFGVPKSLASPLGMGLPFAEILIGVALIPLSSAWLGAVSAGLLLLIFSFAIAVNLARGRKPDCHCFGQLHSEPVGWSTITRNVVLMAIAGFVTVQGKSSAGLSALNWLNDFRAGEIVGLALGAVSVALLAVTFAYLRRVLNQHTALVEKIDAMKKVIDEDYAEAPVERVEAAAPETGLPIGSLAPDFSLPSVGGEQVTLNDLLERGKSLLLLFVSPNCFPCESLFPLVRLWEQDFERRLTIALLSKGSVRDNQRLTEKFGASHVIIQSGSAIADEYRAKWTPAAVLIGRSGRIASETVYGDEAIKTLVSKAGARPDARAIAANGNGDGIKIGEFSSFNVGDVAPEFSITGVEDRIFKTSDFLGQDTALLFWDPGCPFCRQMSEDLIRWEENQPKNSPRLVIVASGDAEKIESDRKRFKSLYLHDGEFKVGPRFGTGSTPSAVLIDRDGRIASTIAMGLPNAMALLGVRKAALPIVPAS